MKRALSFLMAGMMVLTVGACSNGADKPADGKNTTTAGVTEGSTTATGTTMASGLGKQDPDIYKYTVDVEELDGFARPDEYPWIPAEEFKASFEKMKDLNMNAEIETYQDAVDIFGVDGAYYKNCDYDNGMEKYKYFSWYADDETSVLMTFKVNGEDLEFFAWTGAGIN